ncbi:helix-turn-helix transcriptional regulator [Moellerella wisconsensis]|uniref:helix-turn-helix domain-containing protein n=1 Tax=Moellerella wisconsensis TaxID=158849 RepID=UPI0025AFA47D|nr:helix-turn-helix transcriptional regulator [Moellerella wisconsensis]WJW82183.1 helix-turn-helix transcriptional regulator [Moellerella wisconsensis]
MKNINKYVGRKIRLRRKELGFSGVQLSNIIGMSQQQISRYERGECSITLEGLFILAKALDTTINQLLSEELSLDKDSLLEQKINNEIFFI